MSYYRLYNKDKEQYMRAHPNMGTPFTSVGEAKKGLRYLQRQKGTQHDTFALHRFELVLQEEIELEQ
jgi:hypothetical protein